MRGVLLTLGLLVYGSFSYAQLRPCHQWMWVKGDSASQQYGAYGNKGVSNPVNNPSCREGAATWTDNEGNMWMFGGAQYDTSFNGTSSYGSYPLNDLWKYDPGSNQWTWMGGDNHRQSLHGIYAAPKGVPHAGNKPGARFGAASWTDKDGRFWMFGGRGFGASGSTQAYNQLFLNDLWRYDPTINQWTWISGDSTATSQLGVYGVQGTAAPENKPGGRHYACAWVGSDGNLWLFGGEGMASKSSSHVYVRGELNDLWKYNIQTNQWSFEKGDATVAGIWGGQYGRYGTQGQPAVGNNPGSRREAASWVDANGNLWLFGGRGFNSNSQVADALSDLWKYDPVTRMWTWVKGDNIGAQTGIYGTKGIPGINNNPGSRELAAAWVDENDQLWLFGGYGGDARGGFTHLNDLWVYNKFTNTWTWVNGDTLGNLVGKFGTRGVPDTANVPGSRRGMAYWVGKDTSFWVFGGQGIGSTYVYNHRNRDHLNDLWVFTPVTTPPPGDIAGPDSVCYGSSANYSIRKVSKASSYIWKLPQGWSGISTDTSIIITPMRGGAGTISVQALGVCDTSSAVFISVYANQITPALITVNGFTLSTSAPYSTYQWYVDGNIIPGATGATHLVQQNGNYMVVVADANGCTDSSDAYTVKNYVGIQQHRRIAGLSIYPNPVKDKIYISSTSNMQAPDVDVISMDGRKVIAAEKVWSVNITELSSGMYFIKITDRASGITDTRKFIKTNN